MSQSQEWYVDDSEVEELDQQPIDQYDITVTPNDFNTKTIFDFIQAGAVHIPGFQRNYVWDIRRASKLIESLVIGLPVPQVFLYEESRNRFLVIDGQQRLMSIYYFISQRFPIMEKRAELRRLSEESGGKPDALLSDNRFFSDFRLKLPAPTGSPQSKFANLTYSTLGEYKPTFDLRTIRNVIVKQLKPGDDDSAMYEIFNRLNSGGVNLSSQEIRVSLYHSPFYEMLFRLNIQPRWRTLLGIADPDTRLKDLEFLLRAFALLIDSDNYKPSMISFLNMFSKKMCTAPDDLITSCVKWFTTFLDATARLDEKSFQSQNRRFSITIFESVFCAIVKPLLSDPEAVVGLVDPTSITALIADHDFMTASMSATTNSSSVETRLRRAKELIRFLPVSAA